MKESIVYPSKPIYVKGNELIKEKIFILKKERVSKVDRSVK